MTVTDDEMTPINVGQELEVEPLVIGFAAIAGGKGVLKKANEAIVMSPVAGELHYVSRKAFNVFLYHAQQQGLENKSKFGISAKLLQRDAGLSAGNLSFLRERIRNLVKTTIEWGWMVDAATLTDATTKNSKRPWSITTLLSDAYFEIEPVTHELWVYWSYSETLKKQLMESSQYTRLSMVMMARLGTLSSLSLYEIAIRYQSNPSGLSKKLTWEQWVPLLRGRKISEYPTLDFRRFKKETLKPALSHVNRVQDDIDVEFKEFKTGMRITHLQLTVRARKPKGLGEAGPDNDLRQSMDMDLFKRMLSMGINQYTVDAIYGSCDERVLRAAIEQMESRLANKKMPAVKSIEAYIKERIRSLQDEFNEKGASAITSSTAVTNYTPRQNQDPATSLDTQMPRLRDEYIRIHATMARAMFKEALKPQQDEWCSRFEVEHMPNAHEILKTSYAKKGMNSSIVSSAFFMWLSQTTWNPKPSKMELIEFAVAQGLLIPNARPIYS